MRNRVALLVGLMLLLPCRSSAQPVDAFEKLALSVNVNDQVQVHDDTGAAYTGRLTHLTRRELVIETHDGERRFASDIVQAVAVRDHPLRTSALIGAASLAVAGSIAICSRRGGSDCAIVGALGAAPVGAGIGLVLGSVIPHMKTVYSVSEDRPARASQILPDASGSLLEDLGLHVNLNDQLSVEDQSGNRATGRLTELTAGELTINTNAGDRHFTRAALRQVRVRRWHLRTGALIGAGAGATYGALAECGGGPQSDCPDGVIIGGALGAGVGVLVAALINRTTVVYPEPEKRTFVSAHLSRGALTVAATRSW